MKTKPTYQELEKELKILKERNKSQILLDIAGVMFVTINSSGIVTLVNKKACEIFGYEENEMLGKNWFENFVPERIKDEILPISKKLLSGEIETAEYYENPILTKNGEERIIHWHNTPIKDNNGNITEHLSSGEDITDRNKIEQALNDVLNKLREAQQIAHIGHWNWDIKKEILSWSDEIFKIFGVTKESHEVSAENFEKSIHPSDLNYFLHEREKALKSNNDVNIIHRIVRPNGEIRIVHERATIIRKNNTPIRMFGTVQDITEQKKVEQALKESEKKYRELIESIDEGIGNVDENENFIFLNQAAANIFGYSKDEMIGKNLKELTTQETYQEVLNETSVRKKGKSSQYELTIIRKNGEQRFISVLATPRFSGDGAFQGTYGIFQDITEQKKAEQDLKISEEKYKNIFVNSLATIYTFNNKKEFIDTNPTGEKLLGYSKEELLKLKVSDVDENINVVLPAHETLLNGGNLVNYEHQLIRKDRKIITVLNNSIPLKDENGNIIGMQSFLFDITNQKKAEDKLKESEQELREINATKDKFFSIIAHDLKDPFNTMLGFSNILKNDFDEFDVSQQKEFIGIINQGAKNLHKLVENILQWSRSQRGTIDFNPERENLYLLSIETTDPLNQSAKNKSISIKNKITKDIFVNADKNMLLTILRNLISNAIKFTAKGGEIAIKACTTTDKSNQKYTEISIKDNGVGISSKIKSRLFKIDENVSTRGTENEEGTGLGLILCKEFVEKHGGKIWVESEAEKGSEFIFTIPLSN